MTNWLERAKREIPKTADRGTANTDDRSLTAVTAVPHPGDFVKIGPDTVSNGSNGSTPPRHIPEIESHTSAGWMLHFIDHDPESVTFNKTVDIGEVFESHPAAVAAIPTPLPVLTTKDPCPDGMCICRRCKHLTKGGVCLVATPGGIVSAANGYRPSLPDTPQRCAGYIAKHKQREEHQTAQPDAKELAP